MQPTQSGQWIVRCLPSTRPLRVFDVGGSECPEGETLVASGAKLTGLDLDERAIVSARTQLPKATFIRGDAAAFMPDQGIAFDVVLVRRPDLAAQPVRWRRALASMRAWLTPHGCVLLTTPGPGEARLGQEWLDEAGFAETALKQIDEDGEAYLVTAM